MDSITVLKLKKLIYSYFVSSWKLIMFNFVDSIIVLILLPHWKLLVLAFLFKLFVLNEKLWMRGIYKESFHLNLGLKSGFFKYKVAKSNFGSIFLCSESMQGSQVHFMHVRGVWLMLGEQVHFLVCSNASPMLGDPQCVFLCINVCFFVFLGVSFHIRCLGTREQNSSICNVLWGLLNLHSWYSKNIHKSSDILFCQFAWFLRELDLNTLELLCFGKSRITWLKYRKHCKCFNIIGNCSKTLLFWMTNPIEND